MSMAIWETCLIDTIRTSSLMASTGFAARKSSLSAIRGWDCGLRERSCYQILAPHQELKHFPDKFLLINNIAFYHIAKLLNLNDLLANSRNQRTYQGTDWASPLESVGLRSTLSVNY